MIFPIAHFCVGRLKEVQGRATTPQDWANGQVQSAVMDLAYRLGGRTEPNSGGISEPNLWVRNVVPQQGQVVRGILGYNTLRGFEQKRNGFLRCHRLFSRREVHLIKHYTNLNLGLTTESIRPDRISTFSRPSSPPWAVGGS